MEKNGFEVPGGGGVSGDCIASPFVSRSLKERLGLTQINDSINSKIKK